MNVKLVEPENYPTRLPNLGTTTTQFVLYTGCNWMQIHRQQMQRGAINPENRQKKSPTVPAGY